MVEAVKVLAGGFLPLLCCKTVLPVSSCWARWKKRLSQVEEETSQMMERLISITPGSNQPTLTLLAAFLPVINFSPSWAAAAAHIVPMKLPSFCHPPWQLFNEQQANAFYSHHPPLFSWAEYNIQSPAFSQANYPNQGMRTVGTLQETGCFPRCAGSSQSHHVAYRKGQKELWKSEDTWE